MDIREGFIIGLRGIATNKLRSGLSILGIVIGVAAVIAMVSITESARERISKQIEGLGTNLMMVLPAEPSEKLKIKETGVSKGLTYGDALAIYSECSLVENVAPTITVKANIKYFKKGQNVLVEGTTPSYQEVRNFRVREGRFISQRDIEEWRRTAVLGKAIKDTLFGEEDPIGKEIKLENDRFVVIGVMEEKGEAVYVNFNEKVFIPITTAMKRFSGADTVESLQIQVASPEATDMAKVQIGNVLLRRHNQVIDFRLISQEEFLKTVETTTLTFKLMLGGVAAISLLVGGIGIMNIMLVSVTERTREIGIRKAIGATRGDILGQFLVESVTISFVGGIIGILGGILLGILLCNILARTFPAEGEWPLVVSSASILLGFIFSVTVGIFFGIYPAHKASRLEPVDALRYE